MVKGWRNNPAWVEHYARVKKERIELAVQRQQEEHQRMISKLNLMKLGFTAELLKEM